MTRLGKINMIVKDQGRVIKMSTLGPCDGHKDSSWRPLLIKKNPKGLICFGERVNHFEEFLFDDGGCSAIVFNFWLLGIILSLVARRDSRVL